jgi:parallel beta-helix repeat protein
MHRTSRLIRFALLAVMFASAGFFVLPTEGHAAAAGPRSYYVSPKGNDKSAGTPSSPFRSFSKAASVLKPGDTLFITAGTYVTPLTVSASGTSSAPIRIQPAGGAVVIDLKNAAENNVAVTGSFVNISGLELANSAGYCVKLQGSNNSFSNSVVHECHDAGIYTDGRNETITGNTVYHASYVNSAFNSATGWGSGIKVRVGGQNILIAGNTVYNNYGEGIAVTRGASVTVRGNTVHDNYSVNIYVDNSHDVLVEKNFAYNVPNSGFERNGNPAEGIALGEESYGDWGAQLSNITIRNNISYRGSHGVTFFGNDTGVSGGGLIDSTIVYNTLWGSINTEINIAYDTGQRGNVIANNIVDQPAGKLIILQDPAGISLSHNFWVNTLPPSYARGDGDRSGDPMLAFGPGFSASLFKLRDGSPAIDGATLIAGTQDDYWSSSRPWGAAADMGASEFVGQ